MYTMPHVCIMGKERYQTADGNISEGTVINLRKINFGGCELIKDNVQNEAQRVDSSYDWLRYHLGQRAVKRPCL